MITVITITKAKNPRVVDIDQRVQAVIVVTLANQDQNHLEEKKSTRVPKSITKSKEKLRMMQKRIKRSADQEIRATTKRADLQLRGTLISVKRTGKSAQNQDLGVTRSIGIDQKGTGLDQVIANITQKIRRDIEIALEVRQEAGEIGIRKREDLM